MKKLPKLYKNSHFKLIDHNRKEYHIIENLSSNNIEVLEEVFHGMGHSYNQKVFIKTKDKNYETYLVSRSRDSIYTLDNEVIPIEDILFIKKID